MEHKPHHLKSSSAALGTELLRVGNPGIYENKVLYPFTIKIMKVSTQLINNIANIINAILLCRSGACSSKSTPIT
jgi:hypothetical protein